MDVFDDATKVALANEFSRVLSDYLTTEEMAEVRDRNRGKLNSGVCHSHDFCDANMAMAEAAQVLGIRAIMEQGNETLTEAEEEAGMALWSAAWRLAMVDEFRGTAKVPAAARPARPGAGMGM